MAVLSESRSVPSTARALARVEGWFRQRGWEPFEFQRLAWQSYLEGRSGLIHASTGTGKSLAAWLGPVMEWMAEDTDPAAAPALRVLWITPLRALAGDTQAALAAPLVALGVPWTVERRTGDTSSSVRTRQRSRLPSALITTPESLSLLISYADMRAQLQGVKAVVVDEWHELMGTKRGVQVELCLAHLRHLNPGMRTWGLSATMGNLEDAAQALLGRTDGSERIIRGRQEKVTVIDAVIPETVERFAWAGHLGQQLAEQVARAVDEARSALVFTNTRSQAEMWYNTLLDLRPEWAGEMALHHGSLDKRQRAWVERALSEGRLRCVVSTSSLDLGVDFAPVERVLQIGSPKGIARLLQRAGRSGHSPGRTSRVTCVPTHALELVEIAAARQAAEQNNIEQRPVVQRPLDLLCQHLITLALGEGFDPAEALRQVRSTRAFRDLSDAEWQWAVDFAASGGPALGAYPEYQRLVLKDGRYTVSSPRAARMHRMSIGTIVSDAEIPVQFLNGRRLGTVEESFISRLSPGDKFLFSGRALRLVRVRESVAWVRRASNTRGCVPRWMGGRMPLSTELAAAVRERLAEAAEGVFDGPEMEAARPLLELQARWSAIPNAEDLLVERVKSREGHHLFFYPFEGRLVHEGLAALVAWRLSRLEGITFSISVNDYGFELLSPTPAPLEAALEGGLFAKGDLAGEILSSLNATEMARRQFREIARVAGLVFQGYPGAGKSARQLQASSGLIYDVFARYDPENLLLSQARREVLERQLEHMRLAQALERLEQANVRVLDVERLTPLAFPLMADRMRQTLSSEKLSERIARMQISLNNTADRGKSRKRK